MQTKMQTRLPQRPADHLGVIVHDIRFP
jgi:hypothetical protein